MKKFILLLSCILLCSCYTANLSLCRETKQECLMYSKSGIERQRCAKEYNTCVRQEKQMEQCSFWYGSCSHQSNYMDY